jgi:hypothetical protein
MLINKTMKTNSHFLNFLKKQYYPSNEIQLLQRAEVAPLPIAQDAWKQWCALDRLDDIHWQEQKILARMHLRIRELDPNYIHLPRISGFLKSEWARSQVRLKETLAAVDLLIENNYPVMLFKGLAWDTQFDAKGIRLSGDLDVLVPENNFSDVIRLLEKNNWQSDSKKSWQKKHHVHAINLINDKGGNIDIHRRPLHSMPPRKYINGIWNRSIEGDFMGRSVRFCSHADYLALLVAHGMVGQHKKHLISTWSGDFHQFLENMDQQSIAEFRSIIIEIGKPLECQFALSYLIDNLYSDKTKKFSLDLLPLNISIIQLAQSCLNSPLAYKKGAALWYIASLVRRLKRVSSKLKMI